MGILGKSVLAIGLAVLFGLPFTPMAAAQALEEPENGGQIITETNTVTPKTPEEFNEQQAEVLGASTLAETGISTAAGVTIGVLVVIGAAYAAGRTYSAYKYLP